MIRQSQTTKSRVINTFYLTLIALFVVHSVAAETLSLATDDGPPHMIEATDAGIDIDVTREVLSELGYTLNPVYMPLARARRSVKQGLVDLTVPMFSMQDEDGFYLSKPIIYYRPTVFTLAGEKRDFHQLMDIKGLRVSTFQGATGYFGDSFIKMTKQNYYTEHPDMSVLPELLSRGRVDVVVLDLYIFQYYAQKLMKKNQSLNYRTHALIPQVPAHVAFHDRQLRDQFNQQLALYQERDRLDRVILRYIEQY